MPVRPTSRTTRRTGSWRSILTVLSASSRATGATPDLASRKPTGRLRCRTDLEPTSITTAPSGICSSRRLVARDSCGPPRVETRTWSRLSRIALDEPGAPVTSFVPAQIFTDFDLLANGDIVMSARGTGSVFRLDRTTGAQTLFAGDGTALPGSLVGMGGPATAAKFGLPAAVSAGADGSVYIASRPINGGGGVLLRVDTSGVITHVAGTGDNSDLTEGPALAAHLVIDDLVADAAGNVLIAEGNWIARYDRVVGDVRFVASPGATPDPSHVQGGIAVPALSASSGPVRQIALRPDGNMVFADAPMLLFGGEPLGGTFAGADGQFRVRLLTSGGCATPTAQILTGGTLAGDNSAVDTAAIPAANIPASAIFAAASSTLASIDLSSTAPVASPLRGVPLRGVPLRGVGFPPLPLSTVPRTDGQSWESVLTGTPLDGVPAQHVTLQEVLDLADQRTSDGTSPQYPLLDGLTLASIDLSASPLRGVSLASIALGSTPLRGVTFSAPPEPGPFADYCNAAPVTGGYACTGAAGDAPLIAVELAGIPLRGVPLRGVPLRGVDLSVSPLRGVPLRGVDLSVSPLRGVPLRGVLIEGSPLRGVPLRGVPLRGVDPNPSPLRGVPLRGVANIASLVNCQLVNCAADDTNPDTLQTAAEANAILADATVGRLFDGLDPATADQFVLVDLRVFTDGANVDITIGDIQPYVPITLTLADVLLALVPRSELPWEDVPLADLRLGELGAGASVAVTGEFTVFANRPASSTALVLTVPPGGGLVMSSPLIEGVAAPGATVLPDGRTRIPVPVALAAGRHTYTMSLRSTRIGPFNYSVTVVDEINGAQVGAVASAPPVTISEGTPATPPTLADGTIMLGWLDGTPGELDSYQVPVPSVPGAITTVTLSHLEADADLIGYNPTIRPPVSSRGFRSAGLQSPPAESTDPELAPAVPSLDPQTVQDLPIDATSPNGVASVSAKRGHAVEKIEFVTKPGDAGFYGVNVAGYNGALTAEPYLVTVRQQIPAGSGICPARPGPTAAAAPATTSIGSDRRTVFVVNEQRLRSQFDAVSVDLLFARLTTLAARPEVAGTIVRVDGSAAVRAAYSAWDGAPCDAQRANDVVGAINTHVDQLLAAATPKAVLGSIVLVGSDEMLPMARMSDNTKTENEAAYAGELRAAGGAATPMSSALSGRNLLTDDVYEDFDPIRWRDTALYLPDVALGRLVETPAEMVVSIDQYLTNQRLAASTALVAGYDFLSDGATAVDSALGSVIPAGARTTRINDTWTRSDIESVLYPSGANSPQVVALNAPRPLQGASAAGNTTNDQWDLLTSQAVVNNPGDCKAAWSSRLVVTADSTFPMVIWVRRRLAGHGLGAGIGQ